MVKMTRPTIIFFGTDGAGQKHNKVVIRTLLYGTSDKGQYIQNMFIRLQREKSAQNFNVWFYGDEQPVRGSGLYIDKSGIACTHHFLLHAYGNNYSFLTGNYLLQVYIEMANKSPIKIFEQKLELTKEQSVEMLDKTTGIFFDWAPDTQIYFSRIDTRPLTDKESLNLVS